MLDQVKLVVQDTEINQVTHVRVSQQTPRYVSFVADCFLVESRYYEVVVLTQLVYGFRELIFVADKEHLLVSLVGVAKVEEKLGEMLGMMVDIGKEVIGGKALFVRRMDFKFAIVGRLYPVVLKPGS